jgi:hypothetical protein
MKTHTYNSRFIHAKMFKYDFYQALAPKGAIYKISILNLRILN